MNDKLISGKYQLNRELGRGGMGIVYEALDTVLNRTVAIKALHAQFTGDSAFLTRFQREARAMARLDHSSIIRIFDIVEDSGSYYIVMEYFQGKNLKQVLSESKSLSKKESVSIMLQVAKALFYAHEQGIIHRDIKPENIMVNDAGTAKIADFGIAAATDEVSVTMTGQIIGTPRYMSPEQARGEDLDCRSDLYSLGMVLYEMLRGQAFYLGIPSRAVYEKLLSDRKEFKLSFPPDTLPPLQDLVRSLLKKKRQKRLPDAATLATRLSDILSKYEAALAQTRTVNTLPQSGEGSIQKPLFAGGLALVVLLVAGIGAYLTLRSEEAPIRKDVLEQEKTGTELADLQQKKDDAEKERQRQVASAQAEREKQTQEKASAEQLRLEKQKADDERLRLEEAKAKDERERLVEERARVAREAETQTALVAAERKILALEKAKAEQTRLEQEKTKAERKRLAEESARTAKEIEKQRTLALAEGKKLKQQKAKAEQMRLEREKVQAEQKRLAEESDKAAKEIEKQQGLARAEQEKARAEREQKKLASLSSPEADMDLIGNILSSLKTAYEKQDLASLQKMSKMPAEKARFLRQIFRIYRKVQVSITGVSLAGNTAQALVTITGLTSQTGDPAFPAFLEDERRMARITLRKQNGSWGKVIW